ncbi:MAG: hypothetical protein HQL22_10695 [Candidatus Omnitrophica bacterium]|nr:hypothetical protein [Candidatus Omnitrophota bacterium]
MMKIVDTLLGSEKLLLALLVVQLVIYWVWILGVDITPQLVAYQKF